jgi:hypothetical protein
VTDLPAEAVEAAARAVENEIRKYPVASNGLSGVLGWGASVGDLARAALIAALPLLREAWETEGQRAVCSGGGPSREPGKVLIEFRVDEGTDRRLSDEWLLIPLGPRDV